jgi:transposase
LKDEKGELLYCHGNRATLFMSVDFIDRITSDPKVIEKVIRKCHIAEKKIKFYDPETKVSSKPNANNGIKF